MERCKQVECNKFVCCVYATLIFDRKIVKWNAQNFQFKLKCSLTHGTCSKQVKYENFLNLIEKKIKCTLQCYYYILWNNERINIIFISNVIFLTNSSCACCSTGEMRISTNQLIESIFLIFRRRYNVGFRLNTCRTYEMKKTKSWKKSQPTHNYIYDSIQRQNILSFSM